MEHSRERDYEGNQREKRKVLRCERKRFMDRDTGLKVDETVERVIFVIFVMMSTLTGA